jgi:hypothetical protein
VRRMWAVHAGAWGAAVMGVLEASEGLERAA